MDKVNRYLLSDQKNAVYLNQLHKSQDKLSSMLLLKSTLMALFLPLFITTPQHAQKRTTPVEIKGVVTNAETGKPIPGVYLFVTEGEEEALTDSKGGFTIKTWKPLPLLLTSQAQDYHNVRLKVVQASGMINVKLKRK